MRIATIISEDNGYHIDIYEDGACIDSFQVDKVKMELEGE